MSTIVIEPGIVTTLTLNRPEVRNALNDVMVEELAAWAATVPGDPTIRVVVLRGEGTSFCAGADLNWMARMIDYSREENLEDARRATRMLQLIDSLPVPVIGRVQGGAIGGGAGLAALCDVVIAAEDAVFGFTETTVGLVPAMISPYVVRKIGLSAARALCLSGVRFSAAGALEIGLVHEVVPEADLDTAVTRHVDAMLRASPAAIAATKRLLNDVAGRRPADVASLTADVIANQRVSAEGQEGLRAFLDKRKPAWVTPLDVKPPSQ